jgi:hypothetical protein
MTPRRVHTVHLTAPSDTLLRRGAVLLEDALHTASLPEADSSRLWLVRSLNLGKICPKNSAATIALSIEQQFRHLRLSVVHGSDLAAATASIVYFHDITDAYCCFALRLAQPAPISEWFWPSVFPDWQPTWSRPNALKFTLFSILQTPATVMALVELLHRLQQAGRLDVALQTLEPGDGEALLQACGWSERSQVEPTAPQQKGSRPAQIVDDQSMVASPIAPLLPWLLRWGVQDARSKCLAALWLLMDQPYRRLDPQLIHRAIAWIQPIAPSTSHEAAPSEALQAHPYELDNDQTGRDASITIASITTSQSTSQADELDRMDVNAISESTTPEAETDFSQTLYRSPYTGFFGVIPLLNQLGLSQRCDRLPLDFPAHLLIHLAITFGIPECDPIRQLLIGQDLDALFRGVSPLKAVTPDVTAWIAAMRVWSRRYVGMTMAELMGRPGAFTLTRTHLDIFFHHDQADIRIRRAGLDLDPGWVPWLGRVVLFHYGNGE